jgi:hypothetical protein
MADSARTLAGSAQHAVAGTAGDRARRGAIDWPQISHELRTPLNAILGNTELLLDGSCGPLSPQARACLGEVQTAGRDLLRQVRLLFAWSELCAGALLPSECPVDIVALVREALDHEGADAVLVHPDDAPVLVRGDRSRLRLLVAEIIGLSGARATAPSVSIESGAGGSALRFAWSGFRAVQAGALHVALIATIARLQGADLVLHPDGLSLLLPAQRPDRP